MNQSAWLGQSLTSDQEEEEEEEDQSLALIM
jgi:hypothetical protein